MSLHWILVLTVTLLHCSTANPISVRSLVIEIGRTIAGLQKGVCNEPDSTFYSPSVTSECTIKALQCSVLELETVGSECFESESNMAQLVNRTRDTIKYILKRENPTGQVDFTDCFCGKGKPEEKTYKEFLDNLLGLVQMLNSIRVSK